MSKEKLYAVKVIPVGEDIHFNEKFPIFLALNGKETLIVPNRKVYLTKGQIAVLQAAMIEMPAVGNKPATVQPRFVVQEVFEEVKQEVISDEKPKAKESSKLPKDSE